MEAELLLYFQRGDPSSGKSLDTNQNRIILPPSKKSPQERIWNLNLYHPTRGPLCVFDFDVEWHPIKTFVAWEAPNLRKAHVVVILDFRKTSSPINM